MREDSKWWSPGEPKHGGLSVMCWWAPEALGFIWNSEES